MENIQKFETFWGVDLTHARRNIADMLLHKVLIIILSIVTFKNKGKTQACSMSQCLKY